MTTFMRNQTRLPPDDLRSAQEQRARFVRRMAVESSFYRLFDHMPDVAFFAKDEHYRFICANRRFVERFGLHTEEEIIGKDDFDLFPLRLAENFRKDDQEIMTTGQPKLNIVELFFTDSGLPDWFVTNKLPILDTQGRVMGIMGAVHSYEGRKLVLKPYLQLDRAVTYIRENHRRGVSVTELADLVHLSPRQLHRKFVDTFGSSPQAFIMKLKVQASCEALQAEDAQISEVARDVGFRDQSAFTQHFHKHMGMTPLRYVKQFRLVRKK
jgi:PAS domain S-box-containing protein